MNAPDVWPSASPPLTTRQEAAPLTADLSAALKQCRDLTRFHSRTFYFGSRFFPVRQRQAVWAVYATCRQGDDIADEPGGGPLALTEWWVRIQAALGGHLTFSERGPDAVTQALCWGSPAVSAAQKCLRGTVSGPENGFAGATSTAP